MKTAIILAVAAIGLSGCAGLSQSIGQPMAKDSVGAAILQDIQGCKRHYQGALGAGVTGAFEISCEPTVQTYPVPPPPPS